MDTLLTVISLLQKFYGRWVVHHFVSAVISAAALCILSALMVSAMLLGCFYLAYISLMHFGVDYYTSILITAGLFLASTIAVVMATIFSLRRLHHMPHRMLQQLPATSTATTVVDSFIEGFMRKDVRA